MDKEKAKSMAEKFKGQLVSGYKIDKLIDNGKSAAVFHATKEGSSFAVKIFDNELMEMYAKDAPLARIEQELRLVGMSHPNMVAILGGGYDESVDVYYIVMEYLHGENLSKCLSNIPVEVVPALVEQLASAAKFLEDHGLVHRDIKPENIVILEDFTKLKLLDFGVLRCIGNPSVTDVSGVQNFIGTLQYSSPEFLLREEEDSVEGWRAHTFYQIGGVIHDLIVRKQLFSEFSSPYAKLVNAVQNIIPKISSDDCPFKLIHLANSCLVKNPIVRLRLLNWGSFEENTFLDMGCDGAKQRILDRLSLSIARGETSSVDLQDTGKKKKRLESEIVSALRLVIKSIRKDSLPPVTIKLRVSESNIMDLHFAPSQRFLLPHGMVVSIEITAISAVGRVVILTAHIVHETLQEKKCFFEGVVELEELNKAFENVIYEFYEKCIVD